MANFTELSSAELLGLSLCTVTLADYDNDGDLDVLMMGRNQSNVKSIKLYRNNLLSKQSAPNEKPSAPSNLRVKMENNTVILEWDKGNDKETPSSSLTYNVYIAIASKKPFKMFPQSNSETGKRKLYEHGNTSVNTRWTLKDLKTGTYYFSVQSIDAANAGSQFAGEVSFKYIRIDPQGQACQNSEQVFSISPPASYNWTVSGGKMISGQGSEKIKVQWDINPVNPVITAVGDGTSNSIEPVIQLIPSAQISGPAIVCDTDSYVDYKPFVFLQSMSYTWNINGVSNSNVAPSFKWNSPGSKEITLAVTDPLTGCKNQNTMKVIVSERIVVGVSYDKGIYTPENINPTYTYRWEKYIDKWSTISTANNFEPNAIGTYRLLVTNQYDCSYSKSFLVNEVVTGLEAQTMGRFRLVPNPAVTTFNVINSSGKGLPVDVFIYDLAGRNVLTTSRLNEIVSIDCSSFKSGIYIVKILSEGKMEYCKLMIE